MTRIETDRARAWRIWNLYSLSNLARMCRGEEPAPEPVERPKGKKWRELERGRRRVV